MRTRAAGCRRPRRDSTLTRTVVLSDVRPITNQLRIHAFQSSCIAVGELGDVVELQEQLCSGSESGLMVGEKPMPCQMRPAVPGRLHRVRSEEPVCSLASASASWGHEIYPCQDATESPHLVISVIQQYPLKASRPACFERHTQEAPGTTRTRRIYPSSPEGAKPSNPTPFGIFVV